MSAKADLANGAVTARSYQLAVSATFSYDDFTSGTGLAFCALPVGSYVTGGFINITTNWNSGTTAVIEVGDSTDPNRYAGQDNLLAAGAEAYAIDGVTTHKFAITSALDDILVEVTETGTAATAGVGDICLLYVDMTKYDENFE